MGQCGVAFDGENVVGELGEHGGLISGAGADFEDRVLGAEGEGFEHERDDQGLRDGLPFGNGKGRIFVGPVLKFWRDKFVARDAEHGCEDTLVMDAAVAELDPDHRGAQFGKGAQGEI